MEHRLRYVLITLLPIDINSRLLTNVQIDSIIFVGNNVCI